MNKAELFELIKKKKSFLCVGLDPDINKIPKHLLKEENPILAFNKAIIEATKDVAVAYKPNIAFYESLGLEGWKILEETVKLLPKDSFWIADAKRGDIGNTSKMYAKAFLETLNFDSVTIAPYMGKDSVSPFLEYPGKWAIVLVLTSNQGAFDFQFSELKEGGKVYQQVLNTTASWGTEDNLMFVVGATKADMLQDIRAIVPEHFLLVPGVGAQGGSLQEVAKYGMNSTCGLLVNMSRGILYVSDAEDFEQASKEKALQVQAEMQIELEKAGLI